MHKFSLLLKQLNPSQQPAKKTTPDQVLRYCKNCVIDHCCASKTMALMLPKAATDNACCSIEDRCSRVPRPQLPQPWFRIPTPQPNNMLLFPEDRLEPSMEQRTVSHCNSVLPARSFIQPNQTECRLQTDAQAEADLIVLNSIESVASFRISEALALPATPPTLFT